MTKADPNFYPPPHRKVASEAPSCYMGAIAFFLLKKLKIALGGGGQVSEQGG